ncbi:hypothetical protein KUCAC02_035072, partial [Chaenocephalus aceratus]
AFCSLPLVCRVRPSCLKTARAFWFSWRWLMRSEVCVSVFFGVAGQTPRAETSSLQKLPETREPPPSCRQSRSLRP